MNGSVRYVDKILVNIFSGIMEQANNEPVPLHVDFLLFIL